MRVTTKITSKGQITIPKKIREELGVTEGDELRFERQRGAMTIVPVARRNRFEEFRGIGNPGLPSGRDAIVRYFRELRGHDDID